MTVRTRENTRTHIFGVTQSEKGRRKCLRARSKAITIRQGRSWGERASSPPPPQCSGNLTSRSMDNGVEGVSALASTAGTAGTWWECLICDATQVCLFAFIYTQRKITVQVSMKSVIFNVNETLVYSQSSLYYLCEDFHRHNALPNPNHHN